MEKRLGRRMIPQWSDEKLLYLTQNNLVITYEYASGRFTKLFKVEKNISSVIDFIKERIIRRAFYRNFIARDFGISHLIKVNHHLFYVIWDKLYVFDSAGGQKNALALDTFEHLRVKPPLKNGIAVHPDSENVYFGEYITGRQEEVRVLRIDKSQNVTVAYTFPQGAIQHVHSVTFDKYRNRLWITTGDRDESCAILYTDDEFKNVHVLGAGDQTWRAVSVIPTPTSLYWGMDAGKDAPKTAINRIFRYDFDTEIRQEETIIGNPAYHSIQSTDGKLYIGVNFEPGRKQDTAEESAIWTKDTRVENSPWIKIRTFPYKTHNLAGFSLYGYIYLPNGVLPNNTLVYTASNTSDRDYATYIISDL